MACNFPATWPAPPWSHHPAPPPATLSTDRTLPALPPHHWHWLVPAQESKDCGWLRYFLDATGLQAAPCSPDAIQTLNPSQSTLIIPSASRSAWRGFGSPNRLDRDAIAHLQRYVKEGGRILAVGEGAVAWASWLEVPGIQTVNCPLPIDGRRRASPTPKGATLMGFTQDLPIVCDHPTAFRVQSPSRSLLEAAAPPHHAFMTHTKVGQGEILLLAFSPWNRGWQGATARLTWRALLPPAR